MHVWASNERKALRDMLDVNEWNWDMRFYGSIHCVYIFCL